MDDRGLTERFAEAARVQVTGAELDALFSFAPELTEWSMNAAADRRGALRVSAWTKDRGAARVVVERFAPVFGAMRDELVGEDFEGVGLAMRGDGRSSFRWWTLADEGAALAERARRAWPEQGEMIESLLAATGGPATCAAVGVELPTRDVGAGDIGAGDRGASGTGVCSERDGRTADDIGVGGEYGARGADDIGAGGAGDIGAGDIGASDIGASDIGAGREQDGRIADDIGAASERDGRFAGDIDAGDMGAAVERRTLYAELRTPESALRVLELARIVVSQQANLFWKGIVGLEEGGRRWPRVWVGRSVGPGGGWKFYYFARGDELRRTDEALLDAVSASAELREVWTRLRATTHKPCVQLIGLTFHSDSSPSFTTYLSRI